MSYLLVYPAKLAQIKIAYVNRSERSGRTINALVNTKGCKNREGESGYEQGHGNDMSLAGVKARLNPLWFAAFSAVHPAQFVMARIKRSVSHRILTFVFPLGTKDSSKPSRL